MENLKIRVANNSESKEVQELFFDLGYNWFRKGYVEVKTPETIMSFENGALSTGIRGSINHKEITLPELRDLVVLKRNNRKDANVSEENCLYDLYLTESKELYFYQCGKNKWILSNLNGDDDYYESLKPIEKPMKEYLIKSGDGKYLLTHHDSIGAVEIPKGATYYAKDASLGKNGNFFFRLRSDDFDFEAVWLESNWMQASFNVKNQEVLWQRNNNQTIASAVESSHPEELPFIDDEPEITTAKGGELDYIAKIHDMRDRYDGESDEDYRYQLEHYISRKEPSLNDQYAEIEKVRQTLNQRQEQYGSFEDVAMFTEQMVDVMRKGYYEKLAYNQKMALYMICSKMARIVNGNPNHKDSWHDIAGYATLIDNELVSEKDMPF